MEMRQVKKSIIAILLAGAFAGAFAQTIWTPQYSSQGALIHAITWTGTQFVAIGATGTGNVLTSPDGVNWVPRNSGTKQIMYSITWMEPRTNSGSGLIVAVGASGIVITSSDGVLWTVGSAGNLFLNSVTWTGTQLVAVGTSGVIMTSPDGIKWTSRNSGTSTNLNAVVWTGTELVASGDNVILTSSDGNDWKVRTISHSNSGTLSSIVWTGTQLVATGATTITSPDGIEWTVRDSIALTSLTWTGQQLVGVTSKGVVVTSLDGVVWVKKNSGVTNSLYSVISNGTQLIATGNGIILASPLDSVVGVPEKPVPKTPLQNAIGVPMYQDFAWVTSGVVAFHHMQVSTDSNFTNLVLNDSNIVGMVRGAGPLDNNKVYYWRIRAKNANGASLWSTTKSFTTSPQIPQLVSPFKNTQNLVSDTTTLTWTSSDEPNSYRVQIAIDSLFTLKVFDDSTLGAPYLIPGQLPEGVVYYWRVNAKNAVTGTSLWSDVWNFTTQFSVPRLVSPSQKEQSVSINPTLTWLSFADSTSYHLQVAIDSLFNFIFMDDSSLITTSKAIGALPKQTTFYWHVNAKNENGTSPWSQTWSFTTVALPAALRGQIEFHGLIIRNNGFVDVIVPNTMFYQKITAGIYSLTGEKLIEVHTIGSDNRITIPINSLSRGVYLLKVSGPSGQIVQPFNLIQ